MEHLVLGVSGSPVPRSNTDRAVQAVLAATDLKSQFVKLSDFNLEPCRACLGCVETNACVVADDGPELADLFRSASAFVLGAFTPYSSLDARTKCFMERMYCLRHQTGLNRGKVGAAVITTACQPGAPQLPPAAEIASNQIAFWMMEEGITAAGTMVLLGNVPCIRCGHGDQCEMSGVSMLHGPQATVASVGVSSFAADQAANEQAAALGQQIRVALGM